ncbi:MAG: PepSY-like domain-containing protein [Flavobacteriales bacterium]
MKSHILVIALLVVACNTSAQKKITVPEAVKTAFATAYPKATAAEWEMEDGMYEAEWKENNMETSVLYMADGTLVQTETEIKVEDLPQPVRDYVTNNLKGQKIKEAAKIVAANGTISYEAEVGGTDYILDANGTLLSTEEEDEEGEEDDEDDDEKKK